MSFRFGVVGAAVFALVLGGCASTGNGPEMGPSMQDLAEEDLPQWMQDLPEGQPPEDNDLTDEATLLLFQAMSASGERAEDFFRQTLEVAQEGIAANPENAQHYFQAGEALLGLGDIRGAGEMFDRAEEIYPRYVIETEFRREEAWFEAFNRGAELAQAGDREAALPFFEDAHAIYQRRPEAMLNIAEIYAAEGRLDEAADLYGQSIEVIQSPEAAEMDPELRDNWGDFLELARFNQAQIYFQLERYADAADVYAAIVEDDPDNLMAISNLAVAYVASGQEARAREVYDRLLTRPDLSARDLFGIGIGLYQSNEFAEAAQVFREVWERVPQHREALFNYAQSLYLADEFAELVTAAEQLIETDPFNETAYRFAAQALVQEGREHEAVEKLEAMEALPYFVDALELVPVDGGYALVGMVVNQNAPAGETVRIRFHVVDVDGNDVGTTDTEVSLGDEGVGVEFQANLSTNQSAFGFVYEVL